jgi:hypothetical protein
MLFQVASSIAITVPLNTVVPLFMSFSDADNDSLRRKVCDGLVTGLFFGTLPSIIFELSRIALNAFAPKLFSQVPFPLGLIARIIFHIASPVLFGKLAEKIIPNIFHKISGKAMELIDNLAPTK